MQPAGNLQRVVRQVLSVGVYGNYAGGARMALENVPKGRLQGRALTPVGVVNEHGEPLRFGQPFEYGWTLAAIVDENHRQMAMEMAYQANQRFVRVVGGDDRDDVRINHGDSGLTATSQSEKAGLRATVR